MKNILLVFPLTVLLMSCSSSVQDGTVAEGSDSLSVDSIVSSDSVRTDSTLRKEDVRKIRIREHKPYAVDSEGMALIKSFEGLKLTSYTNVGEHGRTIGWGHVILRGENYTKISRQKAEQLFLSDISKVNTSINKLIKALPYSDKVIFSQGFINALGSLIFNCGEGGIRNSTFYRRLMGCRYDEDGDCIHVADFQFTLATIKTTKLRKGFRGLVQRRLKEYEMSLK